MRIDDRQLTESQAAASGKAGQAHSLGRQEEARTAGSTAGANSDQVQLSGLLEGLARALEAAGSERTGRVEQLTGDYTAGRYRVDSRAVSRAIVAEALATGE